MSPPGAASSPSLRVNRRLDRWIGLGTRGEVSVHSGKVELGQGILTALAQIVAEELGVDMGRVRMAPATTADGPDESYTAGSLSIQHSGAALRQVCVEVRSLLAEKATQVLGCAAGDLTFDDGVITGLNGASTTYWELATEELLARDVSGSVAPLPAATSWVGRSVARVDLADKVAGVGSYVHDLRLDGQLFGRVVRPPSPAAQLREVDDSAVRAMPGVVAVERSGRWLGVIATREDVAVKAAGLLAAACRWDETPTLPDQHRLPEYLRAARATTEVLHRSEPDAGTDGEPPSSTAWTLQAQFSRPYLAHASIGPSCAVARWDLDGNLDVWSHSQGIHNLRRALAETLGMGAERVTVAHVAGAGCYGHNGADDAALDAALLARAVPGRPVQVVWARADELCWSPLAPAMVVEISVDVGADGSLQRWRQELWSNGHAARPWGPGHPPLLAARHLDPPAPDIASGDPPMANGGGAGRNSIPGYRTGHIEVTSHLLDDMPLRTSAMRALGAHLNVYAIEQVIDQLARNAAVDPVDYRLAQLEDPRARAVLEAAASAAGWGQPLPGDATGRGVGCARYKHVGAYCAVVAEVEAETEVRVTRLVIAADVGTVVNPDGVANQLEGSAVQAVSWTVKEQVPFDRYRVTSATWEDYPILTFSEIPSIEVILVSPPGAPSLGAGEAGVGPTAAAIGNAVAAALGFWVPTLPLSAEHIVAAMD